MAGRRKTSAPFRQFTDEISYLLKLDDENQGKFVRTVGKPKGGNISKRQLDLLTEGLFSAAFRAFENLVEDLVLLYAMEKPTISGVKPRSFLKPQNFNHCRELVKSTNTYLDWGDPDGTIRKAELVLSEGEPIKSVITSNTTTLRQIKFIRNHIAHMSKESGRKFEAVLRTKLGTVPAKVPSPGSFLNMPVRGNPTEYYLIEYITAIRDVGTELAH